MSRKVRWQWEKRKESRRGKKRREKQTLRKNERDCESMLVECLVVITYSRRVFWCVSTTTQWLVESNQTNALEQKSGLGKLYVEAVMRQPAKSSKREQERNRFLSVGFAWAKGEKKAMIEWCVVWWWVCECWMTMRWRRMHVMSNQFVESSDSWNRKQRKARMRERGKACFAQDCECKCLCLCECGCDYNIPPPWGEEDERWWLVHWTSESNWGAKRIAYISKRTAYFSELVNSM